MGKENKGKVFLVGVGPGDEGLITQAALECIRTADVIVYDHLMSTELLLNAQSRAKIIYAGKIPGEHSLRQEEINRILMREARKQQIVVRLKGGDSFLFSRGAEEALALKKSKLAFEIIPGVSAGMAVASYTGIPLTQRGISSQVTFVTGHEDPLKIDQSVDWGLLAKSQGTLVIFMGMSKLKYITSELVKHGMKKDTPVCITQWGTLPRQKTLIGSVENIAGRIKKSTLTNPAIIIIGRVVNLRKKLNWYESKPLFGKKILITRPKVLAGILSSKLKALGAQTYIYPMIEVVKNKKMNTEKLIKEIKQSDWIIFTSRSAVNICFEELDSKRLDARVFAHIKVAVLGRETQLELKNRGIKADLMPEKFFMESLVNEFRKINIRQKRVFIPHSSQGRKLLVDELSKQGATVKEMFIYGVCKPRGINTRGLKKLINSVGFDYVTFTSSSCVHQFMGLMKKEKNILRKQLFAAIGPITADALKSYGFKPTVIAKIFTVDGLIKAILTKRKKND